MRNWKTSNSYSFAHIQTECTTEFFLKWKVHYIIITIHNCERTSRWDRSIEKKRLFSFVKCHIRVGSSMNKAKYIDTITVLLSPMIMAKNKNGYDKHNDDDGMKQLLKLSKLATFCHIF